MYREIVDIGEPEPRVIGSGLQGKIAREKLLEGFVVVFANLKPKKMIDFHSHGMLMCVVKEETNEIELLRPSLES